MGRRRKTKNVAHWSWRLGGLALCAFFGLGMIAGTSAAGRVFVGRIGSSLAAARRDAAARVAPLVSLWSGGRERASLAPASGGAIAIVERWNGFYALSERGGLRGPISPETQGDLPVLSGPAVQNSRVARLLDYASTMIRAEAALSELVSEMRIDDDGVATLFLDHARTQLIINLDSAALELSRAEEVLTRWHGHERLIAALDLTTPGQAVMRLRGIQSFDREALRLRRVTAPAARARRAVNGGGGAASR